MASAASKLRSMFASKTKQESEENDFEHDDNTGAKTKKFSIPKPEIVEQSGRLHMRADLPMCVPGSKVNRKDIIQSDDDDSMEEEEEEEDFMDSEEERLLEEEMKREETQTLNDDEECSIGSMEDEGFNDFDKDLDEEDILDEDLDEEYKKLMGDNNEDDVPLLKKRKIEESYDKDSVKQQISTYRKLQLIRIQLEPILKDVKNVDLTIIEEFINISNKLQDQIIKPYNLNTEEQKFNTITDWCIDTCDQAKEKTTIEKRKGFKVLDQTIRTQVDNALDEDTWKNKVHPKNDEGILDYKSYQDKDFYMAMLKEIVSDSTANKVVKDTEDAQNAELQKLLMTKKQTLKNKKQEYDRRASKGRKIRYVPIEKLLSFMAPQPNFNALEEHTIDQMFKSLFK